MKKLISVMCMLCLLFSFCGFAFADTACTNCGQTVPDGASFCPYCGTAIAPAGGPAVVVTGSEEKGDLRFDFGDGVVVLDNAYATVRLMSFYQETERRVQTDANGVPAYVDDLHTFLELKVRNNSDREYLFNLNNCYVGDEGVTVSDYSSGNEGPAPGKSRVYVYKVYRESGGQQFPIANLRDLYKFDAEFSLPLLNAGGTIGEVFSQRVDFYELLRSAVEEVHIAQTAVLGDLESVLVSSKWENHTDDITSYFLFEDDGTGTMYNGVFLFGVNWTLEGNTIHVQLSYGGSTVEVDYEIVEQGGSYVVWNQGNHDFAFLPVEK